LKPVDNDELIKKVVEARDNLVSKRKNNKILISFKDDLELFKNKTIDNILKGEIDGTEAKEKLDLFNLNFIEKGIIIFCKVDDEKLPETVSSAAVEKIFTLVIKLFKGFESITVKNKRNFIIITNLYDIEFISKQLYTVFKEYENICEVIVSIGISRVFNNYSEIKSAYVEAMRLADNKLFRVLNSVTTENNNLPYNKLVLDVIDIITKKYKENLTVKTVADELYVSESHLMHIFKENVNKTFNDCLTEFRIIKAKELLLKGKNRINEIAEMVGYGDVKYFGQVFKKATGLTPTDYILKENQLDENQN
jgi:two-component system response regulator YesN